MILAIGPRIIIITLTSIDGENFGNSNNTYFYIFLMEYAIDTWILIILIIALGAFVVCILL